PEYQHRAKLRARSKNNRGFGGYPSAANRKRPPRDDCKDGRFCKCLVLKKTKFAPAFGWGYNPAGALSVVAVRKSGRRITGRPPTQSRRRRPPAPVVRALARVADASMAGRRGQGFGAPLSGR